MLSRKDYSGKLSYEEYVKRHKLREQTKKKIEEFNKKKMINRHQHYLQKNQ